MMWGWSEYVPVATRIARAKNKMNKLKKKVEPIEIEGRKISKKFWGIQWCKHLESFSDYKNRLPRGRSYVRNGSVCHLKIQKGYIEAYVAGTSLYEVEIKITPIENSKWEYIKDKCRGQIGSLLELLNGDLSDHVMNFVANHEEGLFPKQKEIKFSCNCPDCAYMCKHIAAVLYGIGNRLDKQPNLLFLLRGVDASELITTKLKTSTEKTDEILLDEDLSNIFDIEIEETNKSLQKNQKKHKASLLNIKKKTKKRQFKIKQAINPSKLTGLELIKIRTELKSNVKNFAKALNVSTTTIYNWQKKKGFLNLSNHSVNALAKLLKK